jgi:histone H3/H4
MRKGAHRVKQGTRVKEQIKHYNKDPTDLLICPTHARALARRYILDEERRGETNGLLLTPDALHELQHQLETHVRRILNAARTIVAFHNQQTVTKQAWLCARAVSLDAQVAIVTDNRSRTHMDATTGNQRVQDPETVIQGMIKQARSNLNAANTRNQVQKKRGPKPATLADEWAREMDPDDQGEFKRDRDMTFPETPFPNNADIMKIARRANVTRLGHDAYEAIRCEAKCWIALAVRAAGTVATSAQRKKLTASTVKEACRTLDLNRRQAL